MENHIELDRMILYYWQQKDWTRMARVVEPFVFGRPDKRPFPHKNILRIVDSDCSQKFIYEQLEKGF